MFLTTMSDEERRTVVLTTSILLIASLLRFGWEARPLPPILPPQEVPEALLRETRLAVEQQQRTDTPLAPGESIDPNRAPDFELARLPGVGPALAGRLIAHREDDGPFQQPSDLLRVSGIGPATLERMRRHLDLSDPPRVGAPTDPARPARDVRLDLNRARASELETLPGVGPALSDRIIQYRSQEGGFRAIEDLNKISGIGSASVDRLRPFVRVGP